MKLSPSVPFLAACILLLSLCSVAAETPRIHLEANTSFWWTIHEQVENNLLQSGSLTPAAKEASGFNFKQGRVAFSFFSPSEKIEALIRIRLEERTDVIDFWGAYHFRYWLNISIGQMKIPSTAEVLTSDHKLDFITRTTFGRYLGDYSLSRTPYISSIMAAKSYDRDLGLACRGTFQRHGKDLLSYFLMVGNGIGANKYISGRESDEFVYTNRFGDFYYGLRLEAVLRPWLTLGAHGSFNSHDDMALSVNGPVYDLERTVWTVDASVDMPWRQKFYAFFGKGHIKDFIQAQHYTFDYDGWGIWTLQKLLNEKLEIGLRYDIFSTEKNEDGNMTDQQNWTFGLNLRPEPYLRLQLNYANKNTKNEFEPDLDDDIFFLNTQFLFEGFLLE